jgi:hypothetical protein
MITPKEKAEELLNTMSKQTFKIQPYAGARYEIEEVGYEAGKKCALKAVDEILIIMNEEYFSESEKIKYWQEVKQEIEAL